MMLGEWLVLALRFAVFSVQFIHKTCGSPALRVCQLLASEDCGRVDAAACVVVLVKIQEQPLGLAYLRL